jgi:metallophosphoesterase (TIGR00282 family)
MKILIIGDVFAKPGRDAVGKVLPELREKLDIDLVIANAENSHHGKGVSNSKIEEMKSFGVDFFTSGNHVWKVSEIYEHMNKPGYPLIRPANYPEGCPGRGYAVIEVPAGKNKGKKVLVINLIGRLFMPGHCDDPFRKAEGIIKEVAEGGLELGKKLDAIIVDIHAEASSEKMAMAHFLDGKASLVYGTHTHIPTADEHILNGGTAYQGDVGMTGVVDSVLGVRKEEIIEAFLTQMPVRHQVAEGPTVFNALLVEIAEERGLAKSVERVQKYLK